MSDENKPAPSGSLFNFSLSDIFGAGKGIEKLTAALQAGAGRIAGGIGEVVNVKWLDRSRIDNEAYRIRTEGGAYTYVIQERARAIAILAREGLHPQSVSITDGSVSAQLAGLPLEVQAVHGRGQQRIAYENIMQQLNRETITAHAAAELAGDEQPVSDKPVEPDWVTRFLRTVQDISNEEMQLIFGKILAGEIRQPGSFSPRTIDFLATLTKDEAESFRELCAFTWEHSGNISVVFLGSQADGYSIKIPDYYQVQHLHDIGLIERSVGAFGTDYGFHVGYKLFSYDGALIEVSAPEPTPESRREPHIPAGNILLTRTGKELARVCQPTSDPCIMEYTIEKWIDRGCAVACPLITQIPEPLPTNQIHTPVEKP